MASFVQLLASHDSHSRFTELLQLLLVQCSYNNRTSGLGNKPCVPIMRVTGAPQYYPAPNVMFGFQPVLECQCGNPCLRVYILQARLCCWKLVTGQQSRLIETATSQCLVKNHILFLTVNVGLAI